MLGALFQGYRQMSFFKFLLPYYTKPTCFVNIAFYIKNKRKTLAELTLNYQILIGSCIKYIKKITAVKVENFLTRVRNYLINDIH